MFREVRRVPADWQHPKNQDGTYDPMAVLPQWPLEACTHWQMYCTEGFPISPVLGTEQELAEWMSKRDAKILADLRAAWLLAFPGAGPGVHS